MEYKILNQIKSPQDVKKLDNKEIQLLCEEVRDSIINTVSKNGGHLASNLGAVELTIALHRSFSSPEDAIIFDVGHQSYTHKMLTGRMEKFSTIRTENGLSGFMRPNESEHDPFVTGHSSNSISAAYGIYKAKKLKGEEGTAIAVIGDGAMTGGMAYEALNNAGSIDGDFIVVLNDNKMSISHNVGSISLRLAKMRNRPKYYHFKSAFARFLLKIPFFGDSLYKFFDKIKDAVKSAVYRNNIFAAMGFNYMGPVDGHNIVAMESLFEIAKNNGKPALIHVVTTKGKGYSYAEESPKNYHGVSPFDVDEGAVPGGKNFSAVAGDTLCDLAEKDDKICAITAAMTEGTGLTEFSKKFSDRFFDVGIAEQHAVTFGAALASKGLKPFFAVYSSFLQRGFDQLIHDVAMGGFPLRLLVDRAGLVGEDGETHQGLFDVPYLTLIPNINIYSPSNYAELKYRINYVAKRDEVSAVRYPRGGEQIPDFSDFKEDYTLIKGEGDKLIITYGRIFAEAVKAKEANENLSVLKLNKIFPISRDIAEIVKGYKEVYFFEESGKSGGIAEHLSAILVLNGFSGKYVINAVENGFVPAMSTNSALKKYGFLANEMLKITQ